MNVFTLKKSLNLSTFAQNKWCHWIETLLTLCIIFNESSNITLGANQLIVEADIDRKICQRAVKRCAMNLFDSKPPAFLEYGITSFPERWGEVMAANGDSFD